MSVRVEEDVVYVCPRQCHERYEWYMDAIFSTKLEWRLKKLHGILYQSPWKIQIGVDKAGGKEDGEGPVGDHTNSKCYCCTIPYYRMAPKVVLCKHPSVR